MQNHRKWINRLSLSQDRPQSLTLPPLQDWRRWEPITLQLLFELQWSRWVFIISLFFCNNYENLIFNILLYKENILLFRTESWLSTLVLNTLVPVTMVTAPGRLGVEQKREISSTLDIFLHLTDLLTFHPSPVHRLFIPLVSPPLLFLPLRLHQWTLHLNPDRYWDQIHSDNISFISLSMKTNSRLHLMKCFINELMF